MTSRRRPTSTGHASWDRLVDDLLDEIAPVDDVDLLRRILVESARLAAIDVDRLDLKIVASVLREMRQAFVAFAPVRHVRKITVFGSARTAASDPLYVQARDLAAQAAKQGWMVVTGAGPGIMEAAMEGAGRDDSFGVRIRLPFETEANPVISGDPKLVSMKYFFTRKLMLMKESAAYVAMPGGFGTLDETMELLTLQQTGKAPPAPVVLLDVPGGDYWRSWQRFMAGSVVAAGYTSPDDLTLAHVCDDHVEALARIDRFYANFRSIRWFGPELVIRLATAPTSAQLVALDDLVRPFTVDHSGLRVVGPRPAEVDDGDDVDAARVALRLDPGQMAALHRIIGSLNDLVAAG